MDDSFRTPGTLSLTLLYLFAGLEPPKFVPPASETEKAGEGEGEIIDTKH